MKRINKQLLTGLLALSLITPLATTGLTNQNSLPTTHVSAMVRGKYNRLPYRKLNRVHKRAVKFWLRKARTAKYREKVQKRLARIKRTKRSKRYHKAKARAYYRSYKTDLRKSRFVHLQYIPRKRRIRRHRVRRIRRSHQHIHYRKYEVDTEDGIAVTSWNRLSYASKHDKDYRRTAYIPAWTTFTAARMSKFDEPVYHIHYHGHWYWYTEDYAKSNGRIGDPGF